MKTRHIVLASAGLSGLATAAYALSKSQQARWQVVNAALRLAYPEVRRVTYAELSQELATSRERPVLLDVRTDQEYAVSHIPGARQAPPDNDPVDSVADLGRETPIVTYCSIGGRSAQAARQLRRAGYANVRNLKGSIFEWAMEGGTVVRDGLQVREVHPYSPRLEVLLDPVFRAYRPGEAYE